MFCATEVYDNISRCTLVVGLPFMPEAMAQKSVDVISQWWVDCARKGAQFFQLVKSRSVVRDFFCGEPKLYDVTFPYPIVKKVSALDVKPYAKPLVCTSAGVP